MIFKEENDFEIETDLIPEGAIFIKEKEIFNKSNKVIENALKISLKERKIKYKLRKNYLNIFSGTQYLINNFQIEILITDIYSDQISINSKEWQNNKKPQLILLAKLDEEYSYVYFSGVLTSDEFKKLINKGESENLLTINTDSFFGGIDRFISFIEVLDPKYIEKLSLINKSDIKTSKVLDQDWKPYFLLAGLMTLIFGPYLSSPRLQLASLNGNQINAFSSLRSVGDIKKICLISPIKIKEINKNTYKSEITINRPIIFSGTNLKKVLIIDKNPYIKNLNIKNDNTPRETNNNNFAKEIVLWDSSDKFDSINFPINWPINDIKKDNKYSIKIYPSNSLRGTYSEIEFDIDDSKELIKVNKIIQELENSESKWIRKINKFYKTNLDLALALLFSDSAPETRKIFKAREKVKSQTQCLEEVQELNK